MGTFDPDAIKASASLADVIGSYIDLKSNGNEFEARCPFHNEKTPSFRVVPAKGFYHCFGCGAHGDVLDFVRDYTGCTFQEACEALGGQKLPKGKPIKKRPEKERVDYYAELEPKKPPGPLTVGKPVDLYNPKRSSVWKGAIPTAAHPYEQGYVLRLEIDGKKLTPQVRYTQHGWTMMPLPEPRALYAPGGIPDGKQVVVVEGEKAADAAHAAAGGAVAVVSWCGGTNGVDKSDWSSLHGRNLVVIPDKDDPGLKAMHDVVRLAKPASAKWVIPRADLPKGWDVADREWPPGEFLAWCKQNVGDPPESLEKPPDPEPEPEPDDRPLPPVDSYEPPGGTPVPPGEDGFAPPYRILGHYQGIRFYLPEGTQQIVELPPSAHTKANLLSLAPLQHWEMTFPGDKGGVNWDMAINALLQLSGKAGLFNADRLRGRGAWLDKGRAVVHMGQTVYVDGQPVRPEQVPSNYIYQQDIDLGISFNGPATNAEANQLVQLCRRLSWENDLSATLLAGWCVIAPLCGMLPWRPHVWVTGPSASGKSTIINSIIKALLGDMAITEEGKTTEAGIRQKLGIDARPVILDEAEAEDKASVIRIKAILDFARVCSSGGTVTKGTATGSAIQFRARSAFCFSSINTSIKHFADESRISQLVLRKDFKPTEHYDRLKLDIMNTLTPDYSAKMFSRSVRNMATLQENCRVFSEAANIHFRSRRIADQIGPMLAGAYLCHGTGTISREKALQWIEGHAWEDHTAVGARADSERLLSRIATHRIRIQGERSPIDLTVGEAIIIAARVHDYMHHMDRYHAECEEELKRIGILVKGGEIWIANKCDPLSRILADTPWESSWSRTLGEIDGAEKQSNTYFSPGIKCRAVSIPLGVLTEG